MAPWLHQHARPKTLQLDLAVGQQSDLPLHGAPNDQRRLAGSLFVSLLTYTVQCYSLIILRSLQVRFLDSIEKSLQ